MKSESLDNKILTDEWLGGRPKMMKRILSKKYPMVGLE